MARKKRRSTRNNKKRHPQNDDGPRAAEKARVVLDEKVLLNGTIRNLKVEDFSLAGVACPKCDFRTTKTGLSGLQAFRGHWKAHVRNRRALIRPIVWQVLLLVIAIAVAILPTMFGIDVPAATDLVFRSGLFFGDYLGPMLAAVCTGLTLAVAVCWYAFGTTGRRKWSRRYSASVMLSIVVLLIAGIIRWLVGDNLVRWPWLASSLAPWLATTLTGSSVALVRLTVKRREFKPRNQLLLYIAKDSMTDWKITRQVSQLRQQIRDGRIMPGKFNRAQKAVLEKLGLGDVETRPKEVHDRLKSEERKRQVKAKKVTEQEARDRTRLERRVKRKAEREAFERKRRRKKPRRQR